MIDTGASIHKKMLAMFGRKSGEERLKMGLSMFDMAKKLVLSSLTQNKPDEICKELFLRFYSSDFKPEKLETITSYLSKSALK